MPNRPRLQTYGPRKRADERPPSLPRRLVRSLREDVDEWVRGRWWFVRLPLLALFAYEWLRHTADPRHMGFFHGLNLGIHELGHFVFRAFGETFEAWGGSLLQCWVPILAVPMFLRQRDYFAVFIALSWLGINLFEVAAYAGDAVTMTLPLVTPGGGHALHDWNWLLGDKGWLRHTEMIAGWHRFAGHAAMSVGLAGGAWICWKMIRGGAAPVSDAELSGLEFDGAPETSRRSTSLNLATASRLRSDRRDPPPPSMAPAHPNDARRNPNSSPTQDLR